MKPHQPLTIALTLLLAACASSARYETNLARWGGNPLDDLVLAWGPPQSSYTLRDGRQVVEYQRQQLVRLPGRSMLTTPRVFYLLDEMEDDYTLLQCRTRFTVDAQGIIQNWTWDGNACRE